MIRYTANGFKSLNKNDARVLGVDGKIARGRTGDDGTLGVGTTCDLSSFATHESHILQRPRLSEFAELHTLMTAAPTEPTIDLGLAPGMRAGRGPMQHMQPLPLPSGGAHLQQETV